MNYYHRKPGRRRRPQAWKPADLLWIDYLAATDTNDFDTGSATQPLRSMNMNTYPSQQPSRQAPRLQNVNKSGLGNGAGAGWGGFGLPGSGGGFGGLGSAPGLGQGRPGQLSGFAQVMGGGSGQGPIDMR
jgi:CCR4-NOT transcription complex subunit 2